jgi:hypothetical protein
MVKRCLFCGRFFIPDRRVGARQKACGRESCKKARKHSSQDQWIRKNPGYFKGRYEYVKEWRGRQKEAGKKVIQDKIPPAKSWYKLVLLVPGGIKTSMIQDKIILERVQGRTFWAHGEGNDTRRDGRRKLKNSILSGKNIFQGDIANDRREKDIG